MFVVGDEGGEGDEEELFVKGLGEVVGCGMLGYVVVYDEGVLEGFDDGLVGEGVMGVVVEEDVDIVGEVVSCYVLLSFVEFFNVVEVGVYGLDVEVEVGFVDVEDRVVVSFVGKVEGFYVLC